MNSISSLSTSLTTIIFIFAKKCSPMSVIASLKEQERKLIECKLTINEQQPNCHQIAPNYINQ